ncbi:MAG TPA: NAD(P)/FAD-dependent oxidoreductase [Spirochaetota bacterium]|nr:NAD(P)/FAD-dependent oxidoreductase [Spirochaetota bacterium]
MLIQINDIRIPPGSADEDIKSSVEEIVGVSFTSLRILKKSLDARNKSNIVYTYRVLAETDDLTGRLLVESGQAVTYRPVQVPGLVKSASGKEVIVIGTGPAGLFCALRLLESGARVKIIERGKAVESRFHDIEVLENEGVLDTESNVLFGEGGAGTYSDGKLTSRSDRPESAWFFEKFIEYGADPSIAYESKPHVGTDRLRAIIKNTRESLVAGGAQVLFGEKVTDLIIGAENRVTGVKTAHGEHHASAVVLAAGHSARDTYAMLHERGVYLEKKPFAIGTRIEHPAEHINSIQYGDSRYRGVLPAAEYFITHNNPSTGRGIYTFCMCPGGAVINSSSEQGMLCTNGMSLSSRNAPWSNAAVVVTVRTEDTGDGPLAGIEFQREIERRAFNAGGGLFRAPAQSVSCFMSRKEDSSLPQTSYANGVVPGRLDSFLPDWICSELRTGLASFNKKMKGFLENAVLIGAETRTSSPVRVTRGDDFQSVSHRGLYPVGEGAGYAGGIVSSAIDGIRCADAIINTLR